jgi:hypothetical protein
VHLIIRVAEFLLINSEDPRIQIIWESSKKCFSNAGKLFSSPIKAIEITYKETTLLSYFYRIKDNSNK